MSPRGFDPPARRRLAEVPVVLPRVHGKRPAPQPGRKLTGFEGAPAPALRRNGCENESRCLDVAVRRDWPSLDCSSCPVFDVPLDRTAVREQLDELAWQRQEGLFDDEEGTTQGDRLAISQAVDRFREKKDKESKVPKKTSWVRLPAKQRRLIDEAIHADAWGLKAAEELGEQLKAVGMKEPGTARQIYKRVWSRRRNAADCPADARPKPKAKRRAPKERAIDKAVERARADQPIPYRVVAGGAAAELEALIERKRQEISKLEQALELLREVA